MKHQSDQTIVGDQTDLSSCQKQARYPVLQTSHEDKVNIPISQKCTYRGHRKAKKP